MTMQQKIATVFGGSGFLGRYVVKRLAARGYIVRAAVRDTEAALFLKPMGAVGQVVPLHAPLEQEAAVARAVAGADLVINLAGILSERRNGDFTRIHAEGAARIARLSAEAGVKSLVHVSAICAGPSAYAKSKAAGEQAVRAAFPAASILRPSLLFGAEDQFFNRFANLARFSAVIPIVGAATKFQPVYVADVAEAILLAPPGQTLELGGPDVKSFKELIEYTLFLTHRHRRIWNLPAPLAGLNALFLEHLPGKLLTRDQIKLLQHDNIVAPNMPDLASLGLTPTPMDMVVPTYLTRYRTGGRQGPLIPA